MDKNKPKKIDSTVVRLMSLYGVSKKKDLCKKMNVPAGTFDYWTNKDKIPDIRIELEAVKNNVTVEWLLTGDDSQTQGCGASAATPHYMAESAQQ